MITNIRIRNFKGLEDAEFKLGAGPATALVGPNNCGKTSILQALMMWHTGAIRWIGKHYQRSKAGSVLIPIGHSAMLPTPPVDRLWHKQKLSVPQPGRRNGRKVQIQVDVSGEADGEPWNIGVQFSRSGPNAVSCSPILVGGDSAADIAQRWKVVLPEVVYAPSMSEVALQEFVLIPDSIISCLGEGRTGNVLRNILYQMLPPEGASMATPEQAEQRWSEILEYVQRKFLVQLHRPRVNNCGVVRMGYNEDECKYHLASAGRGFLQTLLLLALLYFRPGAVLLLDEPDAHLERVRQRDNFSMYSEIAEKHGSQLIVASHSEVVMNQVGPDGLVGVVNGKAMRLNKNTIGPFRKLLDRVGWEKVMQATVAGHIIFFEGPADIKFLAAFAEKLFGANAAEKIRLANVEMVGNAVKMARGLFYALHCGVPGLRGYALFDRDTLQQVGGDEKDEDDDKRPAPLVAECWQRQEIENYLLLPDVLCRFAQSNDLDSAVMETAIGDLTPPIALRDPEYDFWRDDHMKRYIRDVFARFRKLGGGGRPWDDSRCHTLVQHMRPDEIPPEVREKIVRILKVIDPDFNPEEF